MKGTTGFRIWRIELRRSAALWAAVAGLAVMGLGYAEYRGQTVVYIGDLRVMLMLLIPLTLGIGAWQARLDRRSRMPELLATVPRPGRDRRIPIAGALATGIGLAVAVPIAGMLINTAATGIYTPVWLIAAAAATAVLPVAGVWLGLAIGRAFPWVFVPPLLVVGGLVGLTAIAIVTDTEAWSGNDGPPPGSLLLNPLASDAFGDFDRPTAAILAAQAAVAVAVTVAALLLYAPRRNLRALAVVPVALGAVVALPLLPREMSGGVAVDRGAAALVCTPDAPRVCARAVHPKFLADLRTPGRVALATLAEKLPQAPSTLAETRYTVYAQPPAPKADPNILYAEVQADDAGRINVPQSELRWTLLLGAGTPACPNVPQNAWERYMTARLVAAAWLLETRPLGPASPDDPFDWRPPTRVTHPAYATLLALPAEEQRARVAALRAAELRCAEGDRLRLLTGDRTS